MSKITTTVKYIVAFVYAFIFAIYLCFLPIKIIVNAQEIEYTEVLDDLMKDKTFDVSKYPSYTYEEIKALNEDDDKTNDQAEIEVIQLGEGSMKELYLYAYQPTNTTTKLKANSIAMSSEYSENGVFEEGRLKYYDLELVKEYSVFCKYLVKDYIVSDEVYRYYNISVLWRDINEKIDTEINESTTGIDISVGIQWCMYYENDVLKYESNTFDTVELDVTINASILFNHGITWGSLLGVTHPCNAHFIAFNCDEYKIERIYDADLTYQTRSKMTVIGNGASGEPNLGPWSEPQYVTLYESDKVTYKGEGLFAKTFTWNRIMSSSAFIKNFEGQGGILNSSSKEDIQNSQWVFAFLETEYTVFTGGGITSITETDVGEVAVLRIHFQDKNGTYNLAVVSNKTNSIGVVGSAHGVDLSGLNKSFSKMLAILAVIALLVLLGVATPVLKYVLDFVIWLVKLPFKVIKNLWKGK